MFFEMMLDMGEEEDYYGEDSDRELTADEKDFLDKIDAALPEEVKTVVQNPDSIFEGISFESHSFDFEDEDESEDATEDF